MKNKMIEIDEIVSDEMRKKNQQTFNKGQFHVDYFSILHQ